MCKILVGGQTGDERKVHWKNWGVLCQSKKDGGLGFRDLKDFNFSDASQARVEVDSKKGHTAI